MNDLPVMVITGTSRGIGRGMAEYFIARGYLVFGCSRGPATFELEGYCHARVDVSNEGEVRNWIFSIRKACQRIDVLVCNAGIVPDSSLLPMLSGEPFEQVLKTNIAGTYYVCREVAKVMMPRKSGRIVTMSSMAAALHEEGTSLYSASKCAVVEMSKVLAKELAPLGITCNVLAPSIIATDAVERLGDSVIRRAIGKLTIKRCVTMEEICNVVSFFASPLSFSITGQVIYMGLVN